MPNKNENDFIELLRTGVNKASYRLGVRSKELFGTSRIRIQMELLKSRKNRALQELGLSVYEMNEKDTFAQEEIAEDCRYIADLLGQLEKMETEIERIRDAAEDEIRKAEEKEREEKQNTEAEVI